MTLIAPVVAATSPFNPLLAITPFERPDLPLARALLRQGIAVAVDIGRDPSIWPALFADLARPAFAGIGVRIPDAIDVTALPPPTHISFVVAGAGAALPPTWLTLPLIAQVCSATEAAAALAAGASGLIGKGQESGGRVGDDSSFVLLQRLLDLTRNSGHPVWCQGGMGLHTAAAAFAGGAFGIVIDALLAVLPECGLPADIKAQVLAMDGSETRWLAGYQVYARNLGSNPNDDELDQLSPAEVRARLAERGPAALWPIGQDAALAKAAATACPSVETLVNGLRMRVAGQLHQAKALDSLAENSPWAQAHGTRYPIAQGPMTRVSDTAAFAGAVAEAGGLPFQALALMSADDCRALLTATRDRLGARPWGVGVLGFADAAILEPQLDLVREFRPAALLLAGGRPSQARPFVELGIPTYLHVPSPGLLALFLKDGATHFVFEGRECGGHVGPRYSFVLWEQAVAMLRQVEHPETLHILFAGGIHDARSAAMVAALAAPLAALGARIGVLMGTAYIATAEIVAAGAITADFQAQALAGQTTVLVETAPGHAVRGLASGFTELFNAEQTRLRSAGIDANARREALEDLTLGRLRMATKGLERQGDSLGAVPLARQRAEGMYMIGQAIALCTAVTSVAALHAAVGAGGRAQLAAMVPPPLPRAASAEPVAIIGMACIYPGAPDVETYWANIVEGRDLVGEVPADRWRVDQYYQSDSGALAPGKTPSKWGGFIDDIPFDPVQFGIPPQSLAAIEPAQLLALKVAHQALTDAGYSERPFDRDRTAVIFGAEGGMDLATQYNFRSLFPQYCGELPAALDAALPRLTEDSFPGVLANVISGRIANRLGLGGVNYSVDAACASSLTAIELGVKELRAGTSELVLAGGADFHNGIADFLMFSAVGALSPTGRCRSFDSAADGISLGEGVGVVVLKRLADAQADGDRIYAVIEAIAGSSDGRGLGLTAPRTEGQQRALERTYWQAGVLPAAVGLVEAHGTGTVVGDRTELQTLSEIYNAGGALPGQAGLGSVKSQIGHTKCAAGIAGLIKVAKALHHRVLPPTGRIATPNSGYRAASSPFLLQLSPLPWTAPRPRAAVSAFGFGGTNFHALLAAHPTPANRLGADCLPAELFALRGASRAAAIALAQRLSDFVAASTAPVPLRELAAAAWHAGSGPVQCSFVAADVATLGQQLAALLRGAEGSGIDAGIHVRPDTAAGKVAWLFSGQGSQYPGMLRELFLYFPALHGVLNAGREYQDIILPPTAYDEATQRQQRLRLTDTRNAQPALAMVEMAIVDWLTSLGLRPDMAAGHSFGELAALAAAGAFDTATLIRLARARAAAMLAAAGADKGLMVAVALGAPRLQALLGAAPEGMAGVVLANHNSPAQTVISGPTADIEAACAHLTASAVAWKRLDTACAFHSPVVAGAEALLAETLATVAIGTLNWPVYANSSAQPHGDDAAQIRASLARHVVSPVRFVDEIERMYRDGARVFVEIGPRRILCGLVDRILADCANPDDRHHSVAIDPEIKGLAGTLDALAQLAVSMPGFDAAALFAGRTQGLDLDQPQRLTTTTWLVNGGRARPLSGAPPAHAGAVVTAPLVTLGGSAANPAATGPEAVVMNYLANLRELVGAQREVLLNYLGGAPGSAAEPGAPRPAAAAAVAGAPPASRAAPTAMTATAVAEPGALDISATLLGIVSARTGYPVAMLDLDLDLEADLSIDSIKRIEIIGELVDRLDARAKWDGDPDVDQLVEQLATHKTLRLMLDWLAARVPAPIAAAGHGETGDGAGPAGAHDDAAISSPSAPGVGLHAVPTADLADAAARPLTRHVLRVRQAPDPAVSATASLQGLHFVVTDDLRGLALRVAERLRGRGASVEILDFAAAADAAAPSLGRADGLIHLGGLQPEPPPHPVQRYFELARTALATGRLRYLLAVSALGAWDIGWPGSAPVGAAVAPGAGAGLAGLIKTIAREYPAVRAQAVDLDLDAPLDSLANQIKWELLTAAPLAEVIWRDGRRYQRDLVARALAAGTAELPLTSASVVVLTGGGRGITAQVGIALARRYQCRLEIVGRSPLPTASESELTRDLSDPRALRRALLDGGGSLKPAIIEQMVATLLHERELRANLAQMRAAGSTVNYSALDVGDGAALARFIASRYRELGRIDGVIHGAGVIEDKLVRDKTPESFARVFDTKVEAALTLARELRDDVSFVAFFSSVAATFGNRGQVDYAAANTVLDQLAHAWHSRIAGRVLAVDWGPWADTGMVSDGLRREYARKGIGLIPQDAGVAALLAELAADAAEAQVVLMCAEPVAMTGADPAQPLPQPLPAAAAAVAGGTGGTAG